MNTPDTTVDKTKRKIMNNRWIAPLIIIGLIIVAIGTFTDAIDKILKFTETRIVDNKLTESSTTTELVSILKERAEQIVKRPNQDIENIDKAALAATQGMSPISDDTQPYFKANKSSSQSSRFFADSKESEANVFGRVMKETWDINNKLRSLKSSFEKLHKKHIDAIKKDQRILAREYSNKILVLLREKYPSITAQNVGVSPGAYATGYKHTLVNVREITGFRSNLSEVYNVGSVSKASSPNNQVNKDASR